MIQWERSTSCCSSLAESCVWTRTSGHVHIRFIITSWSFDAHLYLYTHTHTHIDIKSVEQWCKSSPIRAKTSWLLVVHMHTHTSIAHPFLLFTLSSLQKKRKKDWFDENKRGKDDDDEERRRRKKCSWPNVYVYHGLNTIDFIKQ